MPLQWSPFRLVLIMVSPSFVTRDDPGRKGLLLSIKTLQQFRTDGFPLTSVLGRETSRNPSCAYLRISQSVNNCHCTSIADWKLYGQLFTCDVPIRMNNVIGVLQHVWAGGRGRTPRLQSIMQLGFSTSWSLNSLNPASNSAPIDCTTSTYSTQPFMNVPHTFFLRHYKFNYSSLFVTCVRHRCYFHRLLQQRYLSDDRVLIHTCAINISVYNSQFSHCYLYSGIRKKIWGITFWATLIFGHPPLLSSKAI